MEYNREYDNNKAQIILFRCGALSGHLGEGLVCSAMHTVNTQVSVGQLLILSPLFAVKCTDSHPAGCVLRQVLGQP